MSLHIDIKNQIKEAMLAKDTLRLSVVRGLSAAFTNELVTLGCTPQDTLTDDEVLTVIRRAVKQRKDSIDQFTKANRLELAESEQAELKVLETYLPTMMTREAITAVALAKKAELGIETNAANKSAMGQFMGAVMKEVKGKADGADVKAVIEGMFM